MTQDTLSRRRFLTASAATAAAATVPATAAADDGEPGRVTLLLASARGTSEGLYERFLGDRSEAEDAARDAKDEFNAHRDEWVDYLNEHAQLDSDVEVLALEFAPNPDEGEEYEVFLVGDYRSEDELESAEIVDETDREVDERARLESIAADNAAAELEDGYEEFVESNEPPSKEHLAYLAGRYRFGTDYVTSTLLGDEVSE